MATSNNQQQRGPMAQSTAYHSATCHIHAPKDSPPRNERPIAPVPNARMPLSFASTHQHTPNPNQPQKPERSPRQSPPIGSSLVAPCAFFNGTGTLCRRRLNRNSLENALRLCQDGLLNRLANGLDLVVEAAHVSLESLP